MEIKDQIAMETAEMVRGKYLIIRDLCFILGSILPQKRTKNLIREYDELLIGLGSKERGLFNLLVHQMTLLHSIHRMKQSGFYLSEKQDILLSLQLLGGKINPFGFMSSKKKGYYIRLENYYGKTIFKAREARYILGLGKSHTQRILNELSAKNMIYKHKRKGSLGYLYQIAETTE